MHYRPEMGGAYSAEHLAEHVDFALINRAKI